MTQIILLHIDKHMREKEKHESSDNTWLQLKDMDFKSAFCPSLYRPFPWFLFTAGVFGKLCENFYTFYVKAGYVHCPTILVIRYMYKTFEKIGTILTDSWQSVTNKNENVSFKIHSGKKSSNNRNYNTKLLLKLCY